VYKSVMELARNNDSKTYWSILCITTDYFVFVRQSTHFVPLPYNQYFMDTLQLLWHTYIHTELHYSLSVSIHEAYM
jgi:hypothetical protein